MFRSAKVFLFDMALKQKIFFLLTPVYMLVIVCNLIRITNKETPTWAIVENGKGRHSAAFSYFE